MSISTLIQSKLINSFSLDDLIAYLAFDREWDRVEAKKGWHVFVGNDLSAAHSLEIVLPDEYDDYTAPAYIASALSLLSDVKEEDPELLANSIDRYESDLLYVKNKKAVTNDSIEFALAVRQLQELKSLLQHAVDLESRKAPYDVLQHTNEAMKLVNHYRFGHTFRGSFGFTIEAPLMTQEEKRLQRPFDINFSDITVPSSRKVMERVARGLKNTSESAKDGSSEWIVNNYEDGLNANMCNSLLNISGESYIPVEYRVLWSPVMQVSKDVSRFKPVLIDDDEITYLKIAEKKLKEMRKPVNVEVRGLVKQVSTTEDPLGNVAEREVRLRWLNNPFSNRSTNLTMKVNAEAYKLAHALNINWKKVILVEGEAQYKKGQGWFLLNPKNFRVEDVE